MGATRHRGARTESTAPPAVLLAGAVLLAAVGLSLVGTGAASARQPPVLSYGADPLQTVEAWAAPGTDQPVVVIVHGGGFRSSAGDARKLALQATQLSNAGFAVFDVNYRTDSASQPAFPDEVTDVVDGTEWAIAHAADYHGNPADVNLIGGSAGGTIAADAAELLPGQVHAVVSLSGTNDLATALAYWTQTPGKTGKLHVKNITQALGCTAAACAAPAAAWSPATRVTSADCPAHWLVLNERSEEQPVPQADELTAALGAAGCTVTEDVMDGTQHAYDYWSKAFPAIVSTLRS